MQKGYRKHLMTNKLYWLHVKFTTIFFLCLVYLHFYLELILVVSTVKCLETVREMKRSLKLVSLRVAMKFLVLVKTIENFMKLGYELASANMKNLIIIILL